MIIKDLLLILWKIQPYITNSRQTSLLHHPLTLWSRLRRMSSSTFQMFYSNQDHLTSRAEPKSAWKLISSSEMGSLLEEHPSLAPTWTQLELLKSPKFSLNISASQLAIRSTQFKTGKNSELITQRSFHTWQSLLVFQIKNLI